MQRQTIRARARARAGYGSSDPIISNTVVDDLIADSQRRLAVEHDWPWLEAEASISSTAGTNTLDLSSINYRKLVYIFDPTGGVYLEQRAPQHRTNYKENQGVPRYFTEFGGIVRLVPTPATSATYSVGYIREADTVLASDTDEPLIPDWAIDLLIADVAMLIARRVRNRDLEKVMFAERSRYAERLIDEIKTGQYGQPVHVDLNRRVL